MNQPSIDDLILAGAVEVSGIDAKTGEFLYQFTDKLKDVMPELYKAHIQNIHDEIMYFFERGFIDIENVENVNPVIRLTNMAFIPAEIAKLTPEAQQSLQEIKRILKVV